MRGTYVLFAELPKELDIKIGGLGILHFKAGYYAYVGSALGGIGRRAERHFRAEKRPRWHVDYLLAEARAVGLIYGRTRMRRECAIARGMGERFQTIRGFGSSDCGCEGHLFYCPSLAELMRAAARIFRSYGIRPRKFR